MQFLKLFGYTLLLVFETDVILPERTHSEALQRRNLKENKVNVFRCSCCVVRW